MFSENLGRKFPRVFLDSERNYFWWCSQTSLRTSSNAYFGMTSFRKYLLIEVLWFQDRKFRLVFTWVRRTPHTNKLFEKKSCGKIMEWPFFSTSVKKSLCTCVRMKRPGDCFSKVFVFVSCLEQWGKTIFFDELQAIVYQTESSFPRSFPICALSERFWVFWLETFSFFQQKKVVNIHVTRVQPEKCFRISKSLEVFLSFYRKLFPLAISTSTITVHKSKFGKSFS